MIGRLFLKGILFLAAVLFVVSLAADEPPCADLRPIADEQLGYRNRGNRCEGLYRRDVSGPTPEFRLVSLTQPKIRFPWRPETVLEISAAAAPGSTIQVRGQALPSDVPYQMDALVEPESSLHWPVGEVLYRQHLDASRLGVVGWLPDHQPEVYIPLRVDGGNTHPDAVPVAILRSNVRIDYLRWKFLRLENERCTVPEGWIYPRERERKAGEPIEIRLPAAEGQICLEVVAVEKDGSGERLTIEIRVKN